MKYFYNVEGITKYSVVRQQHIGKPLLFPWLHRHFSIVDGYIQVNNTKGTYCCVSMSAMLTRKLHNITWTLFHLQKWSHHGAAFQYYCIYCRQHNTLLRLSICYMFRPLLWTAIRVHHCSSYKYEWKWAFGICGGHRLQIFTFINTCVLNSVFHAWWWSIRSTETCSSLENRNKVLLSSRAVYSNIEMYVLKHHRVSETGPFFAFKGKDGRILNPWPPI